MRTVVSNFWKKPPRSRRNRSSIPLTATQSVEAWASACRVPRRRRRTAAGATRASARWDLIDPSFQFGGTISVAVVAGRSVLVQDENKARPTLEGRNWGIFGRETGTFPRSQLWNAPLASTPDEGYRLLRSKTASHSAGSQRAGSVAVRILDPGCSVRSRTFAWRLHRFAREPALAARLLPAGRWTPATRCRRRTARLRGTARSRPSRLPRRGRFVLRPFLRRARARRRIALPMESRSGGHAARAAAGQRFALSAPPQEAEARIAAAVSAGGTGGPRLSTGLVKTSPDGMAALRRLLDEAATPLRTGGSVGNPGAGGPAARRRAPPRRRPPLDRESRALPAVTGCEGRPRPRRPAGRGDLRSDVVAARLRLVALGDARNPGADASPRLRGAVRGGPHEVAQEPAALSGTQGPPRRTRGRPRRRDRGELRVPAPRAVRRGLPGALRRAPLGDDPAGSVPGRRADGPPAALASRVSRRRGMLPAC